MPIRFRCAYCNQLLGISRRKAGTVVRCPTCAGQVVVPAAAADEKDDDQPERPLVFERDNFDQLLNQNESSPIALPKQEPARGEPQFPVAAPSAEVGEGTDESSRSVMARPAPIRGNKSDASAWPVLGRSKTIGVGLLAGISLLLAFGVGVLLGYSLRPDNSPINTSQETPSKLVR
jgi:DNA-directed RNA polymerase subunit RPC12/RpoP